ncbi:MAG: hypothetical protein KKA67_09380 [Spirochaetes bacterium]|nr:hypothetical protein [Spirochaetota bacterium]MBU1080957.1 hypothetical protein [Spirochaetota bacterium]
MIRVKPLPLAAIVVASIFGGVAVSKAVGYWRTTSSKEPVTFKSGELAGLPNPADIRGSYSWLDIEKAFGVPAAEAARAFSTADRALDPAERVSALEELYLPLLPPGLEIGTGAVRLFVSLYTGLPLDTEEGTALPAGAVAYLSSRPGADKAAIERYAIPNAPAAPSSAAPPNSASPAAPAQSAAPAATVVGKTTFGDLYAWGLSEAQVGAAIGYAPGPRSQSVRDSASANGKEFSELKAALQALLDASR